MEVAMYLGRVGPPSKRWISNGAYSFYPLKEHWLALLRVNMPRGSHWLVALPEMDWLSTVLNNMRAGLLELALCQLFPAPEEETAGTPSISQQLRRASCEWPGLDRQAECSRAIC